MFHIGEQVQPGLCDAGCFGGLSGCVEKGRMDQKNSSSCALNLEAQFWSRGVSMVAPLEKRGLSIRKDEDLIAMI